MARLPLRRKSQPEAPAPVKRSHSPAAMRTAQSAGGEAPPTGRRQQLTAAWAMTRRSDPKLPLFVFVPAVAVLAVLVVVGVLIHHVVSFSILAVLGAVLVGISIFGRRATSTMYASVEGQLGAAAALLQSMRGDWRVTPAVAFTRNQDLVHRVAGRPGVVFVAEGPSLSQQKQLVVDQKRRVNRVAPDVATHEIYVGDGEGQVPLRKIQQKVMRLPRTLRGGEISDLEHRLKALGGTNVPIPKGPMPRNLRVPRAGPR